MLRLVKMFGGVLILRRVAAAYVAALETQAQMHPGVMHLETFLAALAAGSNFPDLFLMTARFRHDFCLSSISRSEPRVPRRRSRTIETSSDKPEPAGSLGPVRPVRLPRAEGLLRQDCRRVARPCWRPEESY